MRLVIESLALALALCVCVCVCVCCKTGLLTLNLWFAPLPLQVLTPQHEQSFRCEVRVDLLLFLFLFLFLSCLFADSPGLGRLLVPASVVFSLVKEIENVSKNASVVDMSPDAAHSDLDYGGQSLHCVVFCSPLQPLCPSLPSRPYPNPNELMVNHTTVVVERLVLPSVALSPRCDSGAPDYLPFFVLHALLCLGLCLAPYQPFYVICSIWSM